MLETPTTASCCARRAASARRSPDDIDYFAGAGRQDRGRGHPADKPNFLVYTRHEPMGVVGADPAVELAAVAARCSSCAPALAAGCTVVVKPSRDAPARRSSSRELVAEAGFPPASSTSSPARPDAGAGAGRPSRRRQDLLHRLDAHRHRRSPRARSSTWRRRRSSWAASRRTSCSRMPTSRRRPNGVVAGIFAATGQTCIAGSRLVVHEDVREALLERLVARARTIKLGDPKDAGDRDGADRDRGRSTPRSRR